MDIHGRLFYASRDEAGFYEDFLYNVLQSIGSMAMLNDVTEISTMATALGNILACLQLENLFDADTERLFNEKISTPPYATKILSYPGNRHIACLFSVLPAKITIVNSTEYGKWIRDIFAYFSNNHLRLRIGVGKVANSLDSLQESFDESLLALQYFQYGKGSILWYERISKNSNPEKAHINHIGESQIVEFLRKGKKEGIERFCRTMLRSFKDAELLYIPAMRSCILDFTLTVERCSGKAGYSVNITSVIGKNY